MSFISSWKHSTRITVCFFVCGIIMGSSPKGSVVSVEILARCNTWGLHLASQKRTTWSKSFSTQHLAFGITSCFSESPGWSSGWVASRSFAVLLPAFLVQAAGHCPRAQGVQLVPANNLHPTVGLRKGGLCRVGIDVNTNYN